MQNKYRPISGKDYRKILLLTKQEDLKNYFALLFETGMRPGEALWLTAEEINWTRREIITYPRKYGGRLRACLPITPRLQTVLRLLPTRGSLFPRLRDKSPRELAGLFCSICRDAGLPGRIAIHCYRLRFLRRIK